MTEREKFTEIQKELDITISDMIRDALELRNLSMAGQMFTNDFKNLYDKVVDETDYATVLILEAMKYGYVDISEYNNMLINIKDSKDGLRKINEMLE